MHLGWAHLDWGSPLQGTDGAASTAINELLGQRHGCSTVCRAACYHTLAPCSPGVGAAFAAAMAAPSGQEAILAQVPVSSY